MNHICTAASTAKPCKIVIKKLMNEPFFEAEIVHVPLMWDNDERFRAMINLYLSRRIYGLRRFARPLLTGENFPAFVDRLWAMRATHRVGDATMSPPQ